MNMNETPFFGNGGNSNGNAEVTDNKVASIDEKSTDKQYPSAKAVYNYISEIIGGVENGSY